MSTTIFNQTTETDGTASRRADLYKIAGVAILIMVLLIPIQIIIYSLWPTPETAMEIFRLFQVNKLAGILSLELTYIVSNILSIPVYLAFYTALKRVNLTLMTLATAVGLIAIALAFTARPAFDLLFLSDQYAAAATDAERAMLLAAGQAKIALQFGTAQNLHYVLGGLALLFISIVMLRSAVFSKAIAAVGIFANVLTFGLYIPGVGIYLSILSVFPFLTIWLILCARTFFQLGHHHRQVQPQEQLSSHQYSYPGDPEGAQS